MNVEAVMSYIVPCHLSGRTEENHEMRMSYASAGQGRFQRGTFHLRSNGVFHMRSRFPLSTSVQVKQRNVLWVQRSVEAANFTPGEKKNPLQGILQAGR
jgi:hypothetical protein